MNEIDFIAQRKINESQTNFWSGFDAVVKRAAATGVKGAATDPVVESGSWRIDGRFPGALLAFGGVV